jgi:hypothetical protein
MARIGLLSGMQAVNIERFGGFGTLLLPPMAHKKNSGEVITGALVSLNLN